MADYGYYKSTHPSRRGGDEYARQAYEDDTSDLVDKFKDIKFRDEDRERQADLNRTARDMNSRGPNSSAGPRAQRFPPNSRDRYEARYTARPMYSTSTYSTGARVQTLPSDYESTNVPSQSQKAESGFGPRASTVTDSYFGTPLYPTPGGNRGQAGGNNAYTPSEFSRARSPSPYGSRVAGSSASKFCGDGRGSIRGPTYTADSRTTQGYGRSPAQQYSSYSDPGASGRGRDELRNNFPQATPAPMPAYQPPSARRYKSGHSTRSHRPHSSRMKPSFFGRLFGKSSRRDSSDRPSSPRLYRDARGNIAGHERSVKHKHVPRGFRFGDRHPVSNTVRQDYRGYRGPKIDRHVERSYPPNTDQPEPGYVPQPDRHHRGNRLHRGLFR